MRDKAFVLLGVLFFLALASMLVLHLSSNAHQVRSLAESTIHSRIALANVRNGVFTSLLQAAPAAVRYSCLTDVTQYGRISLKRDLCSLNFVTPPSLLTQSVIEGSKLQSLELFPAFDYNAIFKDFSLCPGNTVPPNTCSVSSISLSDTLTLNSALEVEDITIGGKPATLGVLGSVSVEGSMRVLGDAILVALGDISIHSISLENDAQLTLLAAKGSLTIDALSGDAHLKAIARNEVHLPSTIFQSNTLLPPLLLQDVLGFVP